MKHFILPLSLFISIVTFGQSNPFENLDYDTVIAYEYEAKGPSVSFEKGVEAGVSIEFCLRKEKESIEKQVTLTKQQIERLELIVTSEKSYGNDVMACFNPHLGIVYYLKDKIVASISICLECNYLKSSKKIPATKAITVKDSEGNSYPVKGFSKRARKEIHDFCTVLGFTKYLEPLSTYLDK